MKFIFNSAGAIARGSSHLKSGKPCQDNFYSASKKKTIVVALGDGAGSCSQSEIGSELCTKYITEFLLINFNEIYNKDKKEIAKVLVSQLQEELNLKAEELNISIKDLSSTLLFVAVKNNKFIAGHIGDGLIGTFHESGAKVFSRPENGEHGNETFFISQKIALNHFRVYKGNLKSIKGFILMSDGSYDNLYNKKTNKLTQANLSFFTWLADSNNSKGEVELALKKTLEDKFTKKTSDDCSVVLLSTEHIEGYMDKVIKNVVNFFSKSTRFKIF